VAEVVNIDEARGRAGLRIVSLSGVPSPWTEAAKGIFYVKGLDYVLARRDESEPQDAAARWVGDVGVPAVVYGNERARTGWAEILLLAERLAPEPALLPRDPHERALAMGLSHEICGEMGLGWCQRLEMIRIALEEDRGFSRKIGEYLAARYGYRPDSRAVAPDRVVEILAMLSERLEDRRYLMGDTLRAVDIHFATFANLVHPLPQEALPMPEMVREAYTSRDPATIVAMNERLREHQRFIYEAHLELPVQL